MQVRQMDKIEQLDSWQLLLKVGGHMYVDLAAPWVLPHWKARQTQPPYIKALSQEYVPRASGAGAEI